MHQLETADQLFVSPKTFLKFIPTAGVLNKESNNTIFLSGLKNVLRLFKICGIGKGQSICEHVYLKMFTVGLET